MVDFNSPLKYHMNDLVYYLGIASGGDLGKQIKLLGAISSMAAGMLYRFPRDTYPELNEELDEFIEMVDMLDKSYTPMVDTNPYLFQKARRLRKGVHVTEVLAYHIITDHNLVAGNIMRSRLAEQFGKNRIDTAGEMDALG